MQNFQNELQMLGMDNYQVGELMPIDYQVKVGSSLTMHVVAGCGRCGFWWWLWSLWTVALVVVEASVVVAVLAVLVLVLVLAFLAVLAVGAVLVVLVVLAALAVLTVGEQLGGGNSSRKFGYFMKGKCPCIRGTSFLRNRKYKIFDAYWCLAPGTQRLMDFPLLLTISQHRITTVLRVSYISYGAVQSVRR